MKVKKGEFGYPAYQTRFVMLRTIFYFALSIAIFVMGYISTGTKENLLTVVAVLGLLPASKSLVSLIMYLRVPKFDKDIYERLSKAAKNLNTLYSLYLTSYKKNFPVSCFCVVGGNIAGYTESSSCDTAAAEAHIKEILSQNGIKGYTVKLFAPKELKRFEERIHQLEKLEQTGNEIQVMELLCDISL